MFIIYVIDLSTKNIDGGSYFYKKKKKIQIVGNRKNFFLAISVQKFQFFMYALPKNTEIFLNTEI